MTEQQRGRAASGIQREIALRVAAAMKAQEAKFRAMEARLAEAVTRAETLVQELEGMKAKQAALIAEMDKISELGGGGDLADIDLGDVNLGALGVEVDAAPVNLEESDAVAPVVVDDGQVEAVKVAVGNLENRTERLEQQQKTATISMNALRSEVDELKERPAFDFGGDDGVSPFVERIEVEEIVRAIIQESGATNEPVRPVPPSSKHTF